MKHRNAGRGPLQIAATVAHLDECVPAHFDVCNLNHAVVPCRVAPCRKAAGPCEEDTTCNGVDTTCPVTLKADGAECP
jgi:hypothetical protein